MSEVNTDFDADLEDSLFVDDWALLAAISPDLGRAPDMVLGEQPMEEGLQTEHVDIEDFEAPEQFVFALMKQHIRNACNVNTAWPTRQKAADWVFMSRSEDKRGVTFAEACRALGARRSVIQARVQYQLYRAGVPFPEPLNFLCDPLHETMCAELIFTFNSDAMNIAKIMWQWPGIRADMLVAQVNERLSLNTDQTNDILRKMEMEGYVALKHGFWFFISRNPDTYPLQGRRRFQWSKAFVGAYD